jgi:mannose-1-phosphate guanylyltransferase/mannose-6-phosphate isomerase
MTKVTPLIICGGNGTRLWPLSRTQSPKQFQKVGGPETETFFQTAVNRHRGEGFHAPCVISSARHRETVARQLVEIGVSARVILEPMGRNTGPAVLASAIMLSAYDPEAIMLVVPADHVINGDLNKTILAMVGAAKAGHIITFGIKPRYAESGFGYITDGGPMPGFPGLRQVERFIEKPPTRKARLLVESDIAYWASGISMFAARTIIAEYEKFDPASVVAVRNAVTKSRWTGEGLELDAEAFSQAAAGPTEQIVFEKTQKIALATLDVDWSDVGSWTAMYGISKSNPQGNVLQGDVIAVETTNSMVRSTSRLVTLVGMKDVIVVDTPDALLVARMGACQDVKKVAEYLKSGQRIEVEKHLEARPRATATDYGGMSPLFQSDAIEMVQATLQPGANLMLDPVNNRQLMVAKGELTVTTLLSSTHVSAGERLDLVTHLPTMLLNASGDEAEVILLTMLGAKAPAQQAAPVALPQPAPAPLAEVTPFPGKAAHG